jgi:hypothetical protein
MQHVFRATHPFILGFEVRIIIKVLIFKGDTINE